MTEPLTVAGVNFYKINNAKIHNTDQFQELYKTHIESVIIRRGQSFKISIKFTERNFLENIDSLTFIFKFGPLPDSTKYTKCVVPLKPQSSTIHNEKYWNAVISHVLSNEIMAEVYSPPDCPVGIWFVDIETKLFPTNSKSIFNSRTPIYILFNPWNKDDSVYMPDPRLLDEYILNNLGKIWVGVVNSTRGREWSFGQFNENVLKATIFILTKSGLPHQYWGDPIRMTRIISKMVNENDDEGVLIGRWDGDYIDGTAPSYWICSSDILSEYLLTGKPVRYGQCWIFAGVVTTICRALGIPSRVVSNIVSAQNTSSRVIHKYYRNVFPYDLKNHIETESIWNYHVWNDVWMTRPDLPPGYSGWQAIDATPKFKSENLFQCGPAPLEAIRKCEVGLHYDVDTLFSSVNARLLRWKLEPHSEDNFIDTISSNYRIGRLILTKKPWIFDPNGDRDKENITTQYKDNSVFEEACHSSHTSSTSKDIEFFLEDIIAVKIGNDFKTNVSIKNNSSSNRSVRIWINVCSRFYNGGEANSIEDSEKSLFLEPESSTKLELVIKSDSYINKLVEYGIMKIRVVANVTETGQVWVDEDDLQVVKPTIIFKIPLAIPHKKATKIQLHFMNPLKETLTDCKFVISGSIISGSQIIAYENVKPLSLVKAECTVTPRYFGTSGRKHKIVSTFNSNQLQDITGSCEVVVFENEE